MESFHVNTFPAKSFAAPYEIDTLGDMERRQHSAANGKQIHEKRRFGRLIEPHLDRKRNSLRAVARDVGGASHSTVRGWRDGWFLPDENRLPAVYEKLAERLGIPETLLREAARCDRRIRKVRDLELPTAEQEAMIERYEAELDSLLGQKGAAVNA